MGIIECHLPPRRTDAFVRKLGVTTYPTVLFFGPDGLERGSSVHPESVDALVAAIEAAARGGRKQDPIPVPEAVTVRSASEMEAVLREAGEGDYALMVVFHADPIPQNIVGLTVYVESEWPAREYCRRLPDALIEAAMRARFRFVEFQVPTEWSSRGDLPLDRFVVERKITLFPTVVFYRPGGTELVRSEHPTNENTLRKALTEAARKLAGQGD